MNWKFLTIFVCLVTGAVTLPAQSNYAVVNGSILDPQHRPIAGAQIHILTRATGATREVVSNGVCLLYTS